MTNLKNLLPKLTYFIYPLFIIVVFVIAVINFFQPKIAETVSFRQSIQEKDLKSQNLNNRLEYLKKLSSSNFLIQEEAVNYALPEDKDVASLIITYEGLSTLDGVLVKPLTIEPGIISEEEKQENENAIEDSTEPLEVEFGMSVVGETLDDIKSLLNQILETRRLISIKDIDLNFGDGTSIEMKASLVSFYFPKPERQIVSDNQMSQNFDEVINKIIKSRVYEEEVLKEVAVGKTDLFSADQGDLAVTPTPKKSEIATDSAEVLN